MAEKQQDKTRFKNIHLFKDEDLAKQKYTGTYGRVYKAKCDGLLCAAKVIYKNLLNRSIQDLLASEGEHRLQVRRFEQQWEFLSTIRHPNIVQYLGVHKQGPDTILLMELMDSNLTHLLKSSIEPIPYHIQVNICHDITLALSFLHSKGIFHSNLSSNNVLIVGNIRVKVTDFGMARFINPLLICRSEVSKVYMPPEAVEGKPIYTEKIDCFSFGVITVQIMTQLLPQPGDQRKKRAGILNFFEVRISERERRQNHISKIEPNHPLLAIAFDCLKDKDVERPSAKELCKRIASLKQSHKYSESVRISEEQNREIIRRVESLQKQHAQEIEYLQQIVQSQRERLDEKDRVIMENNETIAAGLQEQQKLREQFRKEKDEMDTKILKVTTQLKQVLSEMKEIEMRISELELQLRKEDQAVVQQIEASNEVNSKGNYELEWREGKKAPCKISNIFTGEMAATMNENFVYVMERTEIYAYNASTLTWYHLPGSGYHGCALAFVKDLLTLIGGKKNMITTNKLSSLTLEKRYWTEEFPPMQMKRWGACALCTETALIVAGGEGEADTGKLATTEVLNTVTHEWSTVVDLPQQMFGGTLLRISDTIYMMGAYDRDGHPIKSVYTCSLNALLQSYNPQSLGERLVRSLSLSKSKVWRRVTDIPAIDSAYVSLHGQLLAIGGKDSDNKLITAVYMYNPSTNLWEGISCIAIPRRKSYAAVLPDNQLIVVGGFIDNLGNRTDAVDIATIV